MSDAQGLPAPEIGLTPRQFAEAFPFHFAVGPDMVVLQAGKTLARLCPGMRAGARLEALFSLARPEGPITADGVRRNLHRLFLLRERDGGLQLRGSFMETTGDGGLLFLGSPWFTDAAEIAALGLSFDDFALHDPEMDLLMVLQSSKMALADAKGLAARLARQREELRLANARLSAQEARTKTLALIAARTDNGVVLTDAQGRVVWVNEGFTRLTGYELSDLEGRKPGSVLQGEGTDPNTVRRIGERLRRGEGFSEEILNYRKDGQAHWIVVEVQPIRDEAGGIVNYMAIESDITERRASRQRLAAQAAVAAILAAPDETVDMVTRILQTVCNELDWRCGLAWRMVDGQIRRAEFWHDGSPRHARFIESSGALRFARGEGGPGATWAGRQTHFARDLTRAPYFRRTDIALRAGLRSGVWLPILFRGEVWAVFEFLSDRIEEPDETLMQTLAGLGKQVGQFLARREAEEALRRGEERFRAAFEDAHAGIAIGSVDAVFQRVNPTLCEMLGYTEGELLGRSLLEFCHPDDVAMTQAATRRIPSGEADRIEIEQRFVRKDGRTIWVVVRGRHHRGMRGESDLLISHFLDITERKSAEERALTEAALLAQARQRELATGRLIQQSLLIGEPVTGLAGADIAAWAEPSEGIDGDFYAFTTYRRDCFELLVGDVMGKGVPAALVGAGVRMAYNQVVAELVASAAAEDGLPGPSAIVNALHERLTAQLVDLGTFVTLALYRFDLASGAAAFVNAGHTPGLLLARDGQVSEWLGENVPLGVRGDERYTESSLSLAPGERLLVYSDGLTEARNQEGEFLGEARLREFLWPLRDVAIPASQCLQALRQRVRDFVGDAAKSDDLTAVIVALPEQPGGADAGVELFDLPWDAAGLEPLRHRVGAAAACLGDEAADALVLAAFEATTNVIRHATKPLPDATLTCAIRRHQERVAVDIWHLGEPFDAEAAQLPAEPITSHGGFGLYIIAQSVDEFTIAQPAPGVCRTRLVKGAGPR